MAATRTSAPAGLLNGGAPADLHMGHTTAGLDLSGQAAVAAAAAAAVAHHDDYKSRENAYQNNNNLKIGTHR